MALLYCKKCGRIVDAHDKNGNDVQSSKCDYCGSSTYPVPEKYWLDGLDFLISDESSNLLREELVKTAPEFDEYLFNHRDSDLQQRWAETEAKLAHGKAVMEGTDKGNPYGITCPYCKATNIRKIGIVSRSISAGIFGLGSKKIGKQWHCDHCGSDF